MMPTSFPASLLVWLSAVVTAAHQEDAALPSSPALAADQLLPLSLLYTVPHRLPYLLVLRGSQRPSWVRGGRHRHLPVRRIVLSKRDQTPEYVDRPTRFRTQQYTECRPSPEQIVEFLLALHRARNGDTDQEAVLCADRRQLAGVQDVRFLG